MDSYYRLGWIDYVVIGLTLLISTVIGFKFQFSRNQQITTIDYLLAGKNMSIFPIVMSVSVTMFSAITLLGFPMETYRFGMIFALQLISFSIGTIFAAVVITPVFFNCRVSTTYEFLELRFGKTTRYTVSALFITQMVIFMSVVLYAPVLTLSVVTDLSLEASIVVFGLVCAFYCSVGGLKGVLWIDVFQAGLIFLCLILVYAYSVPEAGGVANIYKTALEGERLNVLDFSVDFTKRFTFLNLMARGFVSSLAYFGTSQVEVQRLLSLSTIKRAQCALCCSIIPVCLLCLMCNTLGVVLFTIFKDCDPILDKAHTGLTKYDQVIPYYIVTRLHSIPGLTGLCFVGIFSGSLSTISSVLNSLSTVTVIDFIKPFCKTELSETRIVYIAKALSILYGLLCVCFAFAVSKVDSLIAVNIALIGITEGPMLAIFLVGILTRKGTQRCILFGLVVGFVLIGWIGYGIVFSGYQPPSLPIGSSRCTSSFNSSSIFQNLTTSCEGLEQCSTTVLPVISAGNDPFILYKISFVWIAPIGLFFTLCAIFFAILITGSWNLNVIPANSKCLSPIARLWIKSSCPHEPSATAEELAAFNAMNRFERTTDVVKI